MIVLLNPVFNCSKSLLSFSADKVTTGTYNLQSLILKIISVGLIIPAIAGSASGSASLVAFFVTTQFSDQVKVKDTSQLINGMSNVLQKLFKCFNGTKISISPFSTFLKISVMLLFGRMYVKFSFSCPIDLYSWFFMHFSSASENIANYKKPRCENNSSNRYECRQGTRSRGCPVKEEKKVEEMLLFSPGTRVFMAY